MLIIKQEYKMKKKKKKLLLVEDDIIFVSKIKLILEKIGYKVIVSNTGKKAINSIKSETDIDLILMDINLGKGIDGTEAAQTILKSREIPIIFLSSHTEQEIVDKTEKIASYGYILKSSNFTVIDASIKMALKLFEAKKELKHELEQRRIIEDKLRQSETKFRHLFENTPDAVFVIDNKTGQIADANIQALKITGYSLEELKSMRQTELHPTELKKEIKEEIKNALSSPIGIWRAETILINSKNQKIPIEISSGGSFLHNKRAYHISVFRDITERKKREERLFKKKYQNLFEENNQ